MTYQDRLSGDRSCQSAYTEGDVGVPSAGIPVCDTPTIQKPNGYETSMASETWAQIQARRQQEAREREEQAKQWSAKVTEQLLNQQSKFMEEFTANDKRLFGVSQE